MYLFYSFHMQILIQCLARRTFQIFLELCLVKMHSMLHGWHFSGISIGLELAPSTKMSQDMRW